MMGFFNLAKFLASSFVSRPQEVQPNLATTGGVVFQKGPGAIPPVTIDGYNTAILSTAIVGFSTPDVVMINGDMPPNFIPGETPVVAQNDSLGGAC